MPENNPWDKYYNQANESDKAQFNANMRKAANEDSDRAAEVEALAAGFGVQYDYADRNFDTLRKRKNEETYGYDYDGLRQKYPTLGEFYKQRENALLAKEDIGAFTSIADFFQQGASDSVRTVGSQVRGAALEAYQLDKKLDKYPMMGSDAQLLKLFLKTTSNLEGGGTAVKDFAEGFAVPQERQQLSTQVGGGLGQIVGQFASFAGGPVGGLLGLFGLGVDQQADRMEELGMDPRNPENFRALSAGGAVTAGTERIQLGRLARFYGPLEKLMGRVPTSVKNKWGDRLLDVAGAGAGEAAQEVVEGFLQDSIAYLEYDPKAYENAIADLKEDAKVAGVTGTVARSLILALAGGKRIRGRGQEAREVEDDLNVILDAKEIADQTKLRERSPSKFKQLLKDLNSSNKEVRLDPSVVDEMYQSGIDPKDLFAKVEGLENSFRQAELSGADVVIPAHDFLNVLTGDGGELYGFMTEYMKSKELGMTVAEARSTQDQGVANDVVQDILARAREEYQNEQSLDEMQSDDQQIFDLIRRNLYDRNLMGDKAFTPDDAKRVAALHQSVYRTLRNTEGEAAERVLRRYYGALEFRGPDKQFFPTDQFDLLIDRARNIATGKRTKQKPRKPIVRMLEGKGKVRRGSTLAAELSNAGLTPDRYPNLYSRQGQLSALDNLVASEVAQELNIDTALIPQAENGYVDPDGLLELIRDEDFGVDITQQMFTDPQDAVAEQLLEGLQEIGVDITSAKNPDVKTAIARYEAEQAGSEFFQSPIGIAQKNNIGLYSQLEREVLNMNLPNWKKEDGQASGKEIWQKVKSLPVKNEELEWLGIEDYLKAGDKFTRAEVAEFIRNNGVNVEEVIAEASEGGAAGELSFDEGEIWDDPEAWQHRVEDMVYEFQNGEDYHGIGPDIMRELMNEESDYIASNFEGNVDEDEDAVFEWLRENFADEINEKAEARIEEIAQEEYMDNPVKIYKAQNESLEDDVFIFGNDEQGYDVRIGNWEQYSNVVASDIWSFSEAEIQAQEYAVNNGILTDEDDPLVARHESYVTEGEYDNYREVKLTLPDVEGDFYEHGHFPDRNIVTFLRVTDRELTSNSYIDHLASKQPKDIPDDFVWNRSYEYKRLKEEIAELEKRKEGEEEATSIGLDMQIENYNETLQALEHAWNDESGLGKRAYVTRKAMSDAYFVDEFQSDWHQEGRQKGYQTGKVDAGEVEQEANDLRSDARKSLEKYLSENLELARDVYNRREEIATFNAKFENFAEDPNDDVLAIKAVEVLGHYQALKKTDQLKEMPLLTVQLTETVSQIEQSQPFIDSQEKLSRANELQKQADAERYGAPDAPFKGDAWISLGLKRALVQAVEQGADVFAWADADVLSDRWSDRYETLYKTQYDQKMPSIVKKLTKQKPMHVKAEDNPEGFGYWAVQLTPELKERIRSDGLPMFQSNDGGVRGSLRYTEQGKVLINVFESGDPTTVLHESGHLFLDIMRDIAAQPDASERIKASYMATSEWFSQLQPKAALKQVERYVSQLEERAAKDAAYKPAVKKAKAALKFARDNGGEEYMNSVARSMGQNVPEEHRSVLMNPYHERWAEGFEKYLFEGKAPSRNLKDAFDRFLAWFIDAYRNIRNMRTPINNDIRQVFDRLLATDEEIEQVRAEGGFSPDPQVLEVLNEAEKRAYIEAGERQLDEAKRDLISKSLKQLQRENRKWWNEELEKHTAELTEQLKNAPAHKAYQFFRTGEDFDGNKTNLTDHKLSQADLKKIYGEEVISRLPRGTTQRSGGLSMSDAVSMFGFRSPDQLIDAMMNYVPLNEDAAVKAEELMKERYGDMMNDGTLPREAVDSAMSSEPVMQLMELKGLEQKTGALYPTSADFKFAAEQFISEQKVDDAIKPNKFYTASLKASRDFGKLMQRKDYEGAAEAKRKELFSRYAYKAAMQTRKEVDSALKKFDKLNKKPAKGKVRIQPDYHEKIWEILDRYNLGPRMTDATRTKLEMQAFAQWIEAMRTDEDAALILPDRLLKADEKEHYRDLTIEEFRDLRDSVVNIETQGRRKLEFQRNEETRSLNEVAAEAVQRIYEKNKVREKALSPRREKGKLKNAPANLFNAMDIVTSKVSAVVKQLDGGDVGPVYYAMRQGIRDAEVQNTLRQRKAAEDYKDIMQEIYGKGGIKGRFGLAENITDEGSKVYIEGLGRAMTREQILTVALHNGTQDNLIKMKDGRNWSDENVAEILSHMRGKDWEFVKKTWDFIGQLWPEIAALERRRIGFAPDKIEGRTFEVTTAEGNTMKINGQYMPLMYDSDLDASVPDTSIEQLYEELRSGRRSRAQTKRGHTEERVSNVKKPVRLDLDVVSQHVSQVLTDLTMSEAIDSTHKFLHHSDVKQAIADTIGIDRHRQMDLWLKDVAVSGAMAADDMSRILRKIRHNYTVGRLGWKAATVFIQFTGLAQSAGAIGSKYVAKGTMKLFSRGNPYEIVADIKRKSPYMQQRAFTFTRDVNDAFNLISKKSGQAGSMFQTAMLMPMQKAQELVDAATWAGAYEKAINDGFEEQKAIDYADSIVEDSQGSGLPSAMSAIERGTFGENSRGQELIKAMTMFYSYFNAKYNVARSKVTGFQQGEVSGFELASSFFWLFLVEAALGDFVLGRLDFDDDDDGDITAMEFVSTLGGSALRTGAATVPAVRDVSSAIEGFNGGNASSRQFTNLGRGIVTMTDVAGNLYNGEEVSAYKAARAVSDVANVFVPFPASQLNQVLRGMEKLEDEGEAGVMDYLVFRKD